MVGRLTSSLMLEDSRTPMLSFWAQDSGHLGLSSACPFPIPQMMVLRSSLHSLPVHLFFISLSKLRSSPLRINSAPVLWVCGQATLLRSTHLGLSGASCTAMCLYVAFQSSFSPPDVPSSLASISLVVPLFTKCEKHGLLRTTFPQMS